MTIKKHDQLTNEDKEFLEKYINLSTSEKLSSVRNELARVDAKNRLDILNYYNVNIEEAEDCLEFFKDEINSIVSQNQPLTNHSYASVSL